MPGRLLLSLHLHQSTTMPINNNTQPMLVQCAICPALLAGPWSQFSNDMRKKYCLIIPLIPVIEPELDPHDGLRKDLTAFMQERTN